MAANWRKAVTSVTDMMFPVSHTDVQKHQLMKTGNEYVSNLPLQMSLYFNVFYSPMWLITSIVCFQAKVPELAGSWLLTLLISLPLSLFLLFNEALVILPLERAIHIVMTAFILFEVICGYIAIRLMINYQVTKFHMQQFTDLQRLPDPGQGQGQGQGFTNLGFVPDVRFKSD